MPIVIMKYYKIFVLLVLSACNVLPQNSELENYPIGTNQFVQFKLHSRLDEISGLCLTEDQRLFTHNDEKAAIYQLDYNTGGITKTFFLGKFTVEGDFEGIAFAQNYFYLIASNGILFKFKEGLDGNSVDFEKINLRLNDKYEIEGLCYDGESNSLLIACKEYPGKKYEGYRAVYSYNLTKTELEKKPLYLISLKKLRKDFDIKDFYPSAIAIHPDGKSVFVLSSKSKPCIVELSREGEIKNAIRLDDKVHRQPEGIEFLDDGVMIISDEASGRKPKLTKYFPLTY